MKVTLRPDERLDDLQNGYVLIQAPKDFCYGSDAVLLAHFARVKKNECALDLCTGSGVIPILLLAHTPGKHFSGLEIQEKTADMARRSAAWNHLEDRIDIRTGDVRQAASVFGAASFDVITCNPPYMAPKEGLKNDAGPKAIARHEILCTLEDVVSQTSRLLKSGGRFYMVHRPHRLAEIMCCLVKYHLEPKRLRFVHPYIDREPTMVLIEALKDGRPRVTVEKPLILFDAPGSYTAEVHAIYGENWAPGSGAKTSADVPQG